MTTELALFLLGTPRAELDGIPLQFERRKAVALLAYLAVNRQRHRRDALAALLWPGEAPAAARTALRRALSVLNTTLGGVALDARRDSVALADGDEVWVDVAHFRRLLSACRAHAHAEDAVCPECLAPLAEAAALYRADFLAGFTLRDSPAFDEWAYYQGEALRRELAGALGRLVRLHAERDDYEPALLYARRWLSLDRLNEAVHRQLMELYARSGQQAAALRQYQECAQVLQAELGVTPQPETTRLFEAIRQRHIAPPARVVTRLAEQAVTPYLARPAYLPAPATPLLGREAELATIGQYLADPEARLVTIVGPGGVGKTRLALQAAGNAAAAFPHGVFFVSLLSVHSPNALLGAIAEGLGAGPVEHAGAAEQLLELLRARVVLLLLDNLEHLLAGTGLLADILAQAPGVKVLVTSRERLRLRGEWVVTLGGLPYPADEAGDDAENYAAVQLFVYNARRVQASFALTDAVRPEVARICRLVQGMPLAIELAAAWVRVLTCAEIAEEITHNLDFLATTAPDVPDRHRSLRAVFEHSWRLLSDGERQVLSALSAFRGGFSRAAAERVSGATLSGLGALVEKSLLQRNADGRYVLHDLVRHFVAEKLASDPSAHAAAESAHAHYYAGLLARHAPSLKAWGNHDNAVSELTGEIENVRAAWQWAMRREQPLAFRDGVDGLFHLYGLQGWFQEGRHLFEQAARALEAPAAASSEAARMLARVLGHQGVFSAYLGLHDRAAEAFERGLALYREAGSPGELARALHGAGQMAREAGRNADAVHLMREAVAVARAAGDVELAKLLSHFGYLLGDLGDFDGALPPLQESLDMARQAGEKAQLASSLNNYGYVLYLMGDLTRARAMLLESLALRREVGQPHGLAVALLNLGFVETAAGNAEQARAYFVDGVRLARDVRATSIVLDALVGLATLEAQAGAFERAAMLVAFCLGHSLLWRESRERAERLSADLGGRLTGDAAQRAQQRGEAEQYEALVAAYAG